MNSTAQEIATHMFMLREICKLAFDVFVSEGIHICRTKNLMRRYVTGAVKM